MKGVTSDSGLSPAVLAQLRYVFSRFPEIEAVLLYGSRARGTHRCGSDIDLTLTLKPATAAPENLLASIREALDELDLIYSIDLSLLANIQPGDLLNNIRRDARVVYPVLPATLSETPLAE